MNGLEQQQFLTKYPHLYEYILIKRFGYESYFVVNIKDNRLCHLLVFNYYHHYQNGIEIWKTLDHENIIKFYDLLFLKGVHFLISEYLEGGSLEEKINSSNEDFPESSIVNWLNQITCALSYLHKINIIHKKIKPSNIIFTKNGTIKLCNFLESEIQFQNKNDISNDKLFQIYEAPEIVEGKEYSTSSDIFSLGLVAYQICTKKLPFLEKNAVLLISLIKKQNQQPLSDVFSPNLKNLINKMLFYDPNKRPSAQNILEELQNSNLLPLHLQSLQPFESAQSNGQISLVKHEQKNQNRNINQQIKQNQSQQFSEETFSKNQCNQLNILYSQLLKTPIVDLCPLKQFLYEKFVARIINQYDKISNQSIQYQRCIFNTLFPTDEISIPSPLQIEEFTKGFEYNKPMKNRFCWHLNFADKDLFAFYHSQLFAQDKIQTCEHPILYHLRQHLLEEGKKEPLLYPQLFLPNHQDFFFEEIPTPILITNVLRLGSIDTQPRKDNKVGLYGKSFMHASKQLVDAASEAYNNPNIIPTNIIAICSLRLKSGVYSKEDLKVTFKSAYKGFREAVLHSKQLNLETEINTGNWGCGAFGNNLELIAILQILAAQVAQVNYLKYYTFFEKGKIAFEKAKQTISTLNDQASQKNIKSWDSLVDFYIQKIDQLQYRWSQGDGN